MDLFEAFATLVAFRLQTAAAESNADAPVETDADAPAATDADDPTDAPEGTVAKSDANAPAETDTDAPAATDANEPTDAPDDTGAELCAETDADEPTDAPDDTGAELCAETDAGAPDDTGAELCAAELDAAGTGICDGLAVVAPADGPSAAGDDADDAESVVALAACIVDAPPTRAGAPVALGRGVGLGACVRLPALR